NGASLLEPSGFGLMDVRFGNDDGTTRVVLDLAEEASARPVLGDGPARRVVLAFSDLSGTGRSSGPGRGLVKRWSMGSGPEGARLVLDLDREGRIRRRFLLPPADGVNHWRYVIDIDAASASGPEAKPATVALAQTFAASPPAWRRKVIVIDPGHGGKDPGTHGSLVEEKTVTLAAARSLARRLESEGRYKVVLTRDSDVFIPLEERVQIARRAGADLFISLHADSGDAPAIHGASVYTLSDQGTARVGQVLSGHEWFRRAAERDDDPAVGRILLALSQRSTRNRSADFANLLVDDISADGVDLLPKSHRDASYFVLLAPDVPAVLLEMGFLTNSLDERRLMDPVSRTRLMDAVAGAIDSYFDGQMELASR
ncbi:MAG: N-acetylmuramoyl-L-alanine amidase family protein, partial [Caulobacteraceae bacterium]